MKLLVIDDSHDIIDLFVKVLTTIGHEVVATDNGKDGLDLLNTQKFDAVFLDIAMPNFSGLDVIENLLKNKKLEANPVLEELGNIQYEANATRKLS